MFGGGGGMELLVVGSNLQPHTYCVFLSACSCANAPGINNRHKRVIYVCICCKKKNLQQNFSKGYFLVKKQKITLN